MRPGGEGGEVGKGRGATARRRQRADPRSAGGAVLKDRDHNQTTGGDYSPHEQNHQPGGPD